MEDFEEFLVINLDASYNALLGRPWIRKNAVVPSTYYQSVRYLPREGHGTITVDTNPFSSVETYHAEA